MFTKSTSPWSPRSPRPQNPTTRSFFVSQTLRMPRCVISTARFAFSSCVMIVGLFRVLERDGLVEPAQCGGGAKPDWQLFDGCAAKTRRVIDWCDIAEWGRRVGLRVVQAVHQGLCGFMCHTKPMRLSFMNHNWNRFFLLSPWVGFGTLARADYTFRSIEAGFWSIDEEVLKKHKCLVVRLW